MNASSKIYLNYPTILASSSPQREVLLKNILKTKFEILPHQIDENDFTSSDPFKIPSLLAREKVLSVYKNHQDHLVISADTLVIFEKRIFGKPTDSDDAFQMLSRLSNQTHQVVTGVALRWPKGFTLFTESTEVQFKQITSDELKSYIDTEEWKGKAGGYAIQATAKKWVKYLRGEVDNIVGLPTKALREALKEVQ